MYLESDITPIEIDLQCGSIVETEGNSVPSIAKFHQALHSIYIPHKSTETSLLSIEFPSHLYKEPAGFLSSTADSKDLWEINFDMQNYANEYDPSFFPSAFPTLYPYGVGGFQDLYRIPSVPVDTHIKTLLLQYHELYACHEIFMFVVYNVIQRREICGSSRLVTDRRMLPNVCEILRQLDYETISQALSSVPSSSPHSVSDNPDPRVRKLMELTSVANARIRGTYEYMQQCRNEIRALFVRFGAPHFFITINSDDDHHPLILAISSSRPISVPTSASRYQ